MSTKEWIELAATLIQTSALILGGVYALYEYRRFRRFSAKIELDVDFSLHSLPGMEDTYLLDIEITVHNLGLIRKSFPEINIHVKSLTAENIQTALENKERLRFSRELISWHNIVHNPRDPYWVDAGATQKFRYPLVVENPGDFIQVNVNFNYYRDRNNQKEEAYHQATRVRAAAELLKHD
jgi:hypothetical protein